MTMAVAAPKALGERAAGAKMPEMTVMAMAAGRWEDRTEEGAVLAKVLALEKAAVEVLTMMVGMAEIPLVGMAPTVGPETGGAAREVLALATALARAPALAMVTASARAPATASARAPALAAAARDTVTGVARAMARTVAKDMANLPRVEKVTTAGLVLLLCGREGGSPQIAFGGRLALDSSSIRFANC
mmetsp:Transcript_21130/g.37608  ORF Transcript_21130/g.37608 Transcript_21130/m.37608 type:complete len:189 (+) Transcript_21130:64-630(+)